MKKAIWLNEVKYDNHFRIWWKVFLWFREKCFYDFPYIWSKSNKIDLNLNKKKEQKDNDNNLELRLNLAQIKVGEAPLNWE